MAGLALFATTSAAEEIDTAVKKMGFEARVDRVPALDWDAVVKVTVSAILVLLIFNGLYAVIWNDLNLISVIPSAEPTKTNIIRFAILFTIAYTIIMWLAIQLKRRWRRVSQLEKRPENLLIACVSYISTVWINLIINYYVTGGHLTYAPLLFALNQAVFGYFVGIYIDRHVDNKALSIRLAIYQGCAQAVAMTIATTFSPSLVLSELAPFVMLRIGLIMSVFSMLQSGISGFVVGVLFQKVYNKSPRAFPESAVGGAYPGQESKGEQTDRMVARA
jgi:MFS family permease